MNWVNGPLVCTLDVGGCLLAQIVRQDGGTWTGYDLTGENGAVRIGGYRTVEEARPAVEKYMEAKL